MPDSPDVLIAKQLLDQLKSVGFQFRRVAPGEDGPLVGHRINGECVDLVHLEGFSRDCFAWRQRASSLIVSGTALVQRQVDGGALTVLNEVLSWQTAP
ncbi:MAG TPA: hypothetical protein VF003_01670 [Pseudonocardiaceae bacterium]